MAQTPTFDQILTLVGVVLGAVLLLGMAIVPALLDRDSEPSPRRKGVIRPLSSPAAGVSVTS